MRISAPPPGSSSAPLSRPGADQRERLRSSRPAGATDTVYRVRGPGGWDGQVGLQSLQTHCAPKKPVTASELTSQEVQMPVSTLYFAVCSAGYTGSARRMPGRPVAR